MKTTFYWILTIEKILAVLLIYLIVTNMLDFESAVEVYDQTLIDMETEFGKPEFAMKLYTYSGSLDGVLIKNWTIFPILITSFVLSLIEVFLYFKLLKLRK